MSVLSEHVEQTKQKAGTGLAPLPRVNLLPPEIAERVVFRRIQYGLGSGMLAAVGVVALLFLAAAGSVNDANAEVQTANETNSKLKSDTKRYAQVETVYAQAAAADAMLAKAMGDEIRFSEYLYGLGLTIPGNVWMTEVKFKQAPVPPFVGSTQPGVGTVAFKGKGFKHDDVAVFLESLAKQKGYAHPYFSNSERELVGEAKRPLINFESSVVLTSDAISPRYSGPKGG